MKVSLTHLTLNFIFSVITLSSMLFSFGCRHNPNKAEVLKTEITNTETISSTERVGVNDDKDMVYQKRLNMAEELRRLHNSVNEAEDRVFGTREYNTLGLYGKYRDCYLKATPETQKTLPDPQGISRWKDKGEDVKMGIDPDTKKLAMLTEEKLHDRIQRYKEYKKGLNTKEDELQLGLDKCNASMATK